MRFCPYQSNQTKKVLKVISIAFICIAFFCYHNFGVVYRSIVDVNMRSSYMTLLDTKFQIVEFFSSKPKDLPVRRDLVVKMHPTNYVLLQKERAKKTKNYILNNAIIDTDAIDSIKNTYYKAKLMLGNHTTKAKLKLFGLYPDHFGDSDGHSFRVKYKGETEFGKKKVNVLKPITRSFNLDRLLNIIYKRTFKGLDISAEPVNVIFNKEAYGVYLIEDFFDKYLIEENLKRESLIFELTKNKIHFNHVPKHDKMQRQQVFLETLVANADYKSFFEKINKEKLFGYLALVLITNNNHSSLDINLHWFYNAVSNTFEPTIRETKIKKIPEKVFENQFYTHMLSVLGNRNGVLTDWMSYVGEKAFNKGISQSLVKIEKAFNSIEKDTTYNHFKHKLMGFKSEMASNEKRFLNNIKKLQKKAHPKVVKPIQEYLKITKDTLINSDMVITENTSLVIEKGVTITLANNADLIIKSGQLTIKGTAEKKVLFITEENSNSSIYIQSKKYTKASYAIFSGLSALHKELWKLPSSFTLFESDAEFLNCEFLKNKEGDDMVNAFSCKNVLFKGCVFSNIKSDAIDTDFSNATIADCLFTKIGNDAIDGSGSTLLINNNVFEYVEDKVISAGEESNFITKSNTIKNSELGIVCKDGSYLKSEKDILIDNTIDVVVFKKKPIYGFPSLELIDTKITTNLIEKGSGLKGVMNPVFTKNINKKLYGNRFGKATE